MDQQIAQERFRALLESLPDAVVTVNRDGRITMVNSQTEKLFGYTRVQLVGQKVEVLLPERFQGHHVAHRTGYFHEPGVRSMGAGLDLFGRRQDGSEFPVEISLSPIETEEGVLVISAIRDISARKRAEQEFRVLLECAPDAIVIVNRSGAITLVNSQTEKLFGYTRQELLGQKVELLLPGRFKDRRVGRRTNDIRAIIMDLDLKRSQDPQAGRRTGYFGGSDVRPIGAGLELFGRRQDGSEFPVEIRLSPIETEEGVFVFSSIRDITEQERLHRKKEELEQQYGRVQEANRLKSEFLANMSHELRTPLNAIIGFTELMHDGKTGPISDRQEEYLGDVLTSSRHLLHLINDVLDLSKIESGKMEFHPETTDLGKLVGEVTDILRTLCAGKRMRLETEIDPAVTVVVTDPAKLKQVLYNFVSNALKFTPDEGRVAIRILPEGADSFRLEVEDTGIGIRPEDLGRLFVEFQQLDSGGAKKYPGTGLGLALTKRIIEAQGGKVGVRSTWGEGSVFFAVLPRVAPEPLHPVVPRPEAPQVLVVEDDSKDRRWLVRTLSEAGYSVEAVATGAEGIARCRERAFDAVILDLLLPDISGWEVLRAMHAEGPNRSTPVVVVTVMAEKDIGAGFSIWDILTKPVHPEDLLATLHRAKVFPDKTRAVLIVDDDLHDLKLAGAILEEAGYQPICAPDGESGLRVAAEENLAAAVVDLTMPGIDGFEFVRRFRMTAAGRRTPVIVWTNQDVSASDRALLHASVQAIVQKGSGGATDLLEELRAQLSRPGAAEDLAAIAKATEAPPRAESKEPVRKQ